jgi:hypothetical protein
VVYSVESPDNWPTIETGFLSNGIFMQSWPFFLLLVAVCIVPVGSTDADHLTLQISGQTVELDGEILIEAKDESLYFRGVDGKIWLVEAQQIKDKVDDDQAIEPLSKKEIGNRLLKELPDGFRIYETKHYVIAYQTEVAYARWVGGLYESRLYRGFETFWQKKKKFTLTDPEYPLVAIIFSSRAQYQQYVDRELGPGQNMIAYYNLQSNRVAMFDLTADRRNPNQPLDERRIDQVLRNPAAIAMVATMIHEATHQLIFNRGVQTRFAEAPLWLNEGLAMYFEAPDLGSKRGWQVPGLIFEQRLMAFRRYLRNRPADSLKSLIISDERLRNSDTAPQAYAEAWALNHFLLNRRSKEYIAYIEHMSAKKALVEDSPAQRLKEFQQFIGEDLAELDKQFIAYVRKLK